MRYPFSLGKNPCGAVGDRWVYMKTPFQVENDLKGDFIMTRRKLFSTKIKANVDKKATNFRFVFIYLHFKVVTQSLEELKI